MRVDSVKPQTSFQAKLPKKRFITENMRASIASLLLRMNGETKVNKQGDYFISTITNKLKDIEENTVFEDERRFKSRVPYVEQMKGFSILKFGRTRLDIDNESGEIIDAKKPFYKPWFAVLNRAEEVLNTLRANFNNNDVVQKEYIKLQELTPEGKKAMKKFVLQLEKQRLEGVIKNLEKEVENEG